MDMKKESILKAAKSFIDFVQDSSKGVSPRDQQLVQDTLNEEMARLEHAESDDDAWNIFNRMVLNVFSVIGGYRPEIVALAQEGLQRSALILEHHGDPTLLREGAADLLLRMKRTTKDPGLTVGQHYLRGQSPLPPEANDKPYERELLYNQAHMLRWLITDVSNDELRAAIKTILTMRDQHGKYEEGEVLYTVVDVHLSWRGDPDAIAQAATDKMVATHHGRVTSVPEPTDEEPDENGERVYVQTCRFQSEESATKFVAELQEAQKSGTLFDALINEFEFEKFETEIHEAYESWALV